MKRYRLYIIKYLNCSGVILKGSIIYQKHSEARQEDTRYGGVEKALTTITYR